MVIFAVPAIVLAAYLLTCFLIWKWQSRLIFMPSRKLSRTPSSLGVPGEEMRISFHSKDGRSEELDAFWLSGDGPCALLYLHGNGDNIGVNLPHAALLRSLGVSVLLFDYRGYGRSTGPFPSEARVYEDAEVGWRHLASRYSAHQIIIYGHSLGGAIAIELASRHPEARGLIVESSFTTAADMARRLPPFWLFPLDLLLHHRFDSLAKIGALRPPVLLVHGSRDWSVPARMTKQLFAAAPDPKTLVMIDGGGHLDNSIIGGDIYREAVREFIR